MLLIFTVKPIAHFYLLEKNVSACDGGGLLNPFRTALPFLGTLLTLIPSDMSPKRECSSKGVDLPNIVGISFVFFHCSSS